MSLDELKQAISALDSDKALFALVRERGFKEVDRASRNDNILSEHTGMVGSVPVLIRFSWHDPSQAFSIQPDIHKVQLVVESQVVATTSWEDV